MKDSTITQKPENGHHETNVNDLEYFTCLFVLQIRISSRWNTEFKLTPLLELVNK